MSRDYGMQINNELVVYTASQIKHEIDGEIMNDLLRVASAPQVQWSATPKQGVSLTDHNESFYNTIVEASNNIFQATKLATGSFIIAGMKAANVIETLPRFSPELSPNSVGPHKVGNLSGMDVYKNPFFPADKFLVGYKGSGLFDAGYLYCPYMPIDSNFDNSELLVA